jgi:hypothetical protein
VSGKSITSGVIEFDGAARILREMFNVIASQRAARMRAR